MSGISEVLHISKISISLENRTSANDCKISGLSLPTNIRRVASSPSINTSKGLFIDGSRPNVFNFSKINLILSLISFPEPTLPSTSHASIIVWINSAEGSGGVPSIVFI